MDWFLYDNGLRHERVKIIKFNLYYPETVLFNYWLYLFSQELKNN